MGVAYLKGAGLAQLRRMPEFLALPEDKAARIVEHIDNRNYTLGQRACANSDRAHAQQERQDRERHRDNFGAYLAYSDATMLLGMSDSEVINLLPALGEQLTGHLMEKRRALAGQAAKPAKIAEARMDADDFKQIAQGRSGAVRTRQG